MIIKPNQALKNISQALNEQKWLHFLSKVVTENKQYDMGYGMSSLMKKLRHHPKGVIIDRMWGWSRDFININTLVDLQMIYLKLDSFAHTTFKAIPTRQGRTYLRQWNHICKHKYGTQALALLIRFVIDHHLCRNDSYEKMKYHLTHIMFHDHKHSTLGDQVKESLENDPDVFDTTMTPNVMNDAVSGAIPTTNARDFVRISEHRRALAQESLSANMRMMKESASAHLTQLSEQTSLENQRSRRAYIRALAHRSHH